MLIALLMLMIIANPKKSIDILKNEGAKSGITLYDDEIKNIEVIA